LAPRSIAVLPDEPAGTWEARSNLYSNLGRFSTFFPRTAVTDLIKARTVKF
jgi:hypothetical protein